MEVELVGIEAGEEGEEGRAVDEDGGEDEALEGGEIEDVSAGGVSEGAAADEIVPAGEI